MIFHSHANKTHFHKKGWAPNLVLIQRPGGTRKWPIERVIASFPLTIASNPQSIQPFNDVILCSSSSLVGWWAFVNETASPILQINALLSATLATVSSVPSRRSATVAVVPQCCTMIFFVTYNNNLLKTAYWEHIINYINVLYLCHCYYHYYYYH